MGLIRFLLAVCVVIVHADPLWGIIGPGREWNFGLNGDQAVTSFFIISGFLIALILDVRYDRVRTFYITRLARIYLPYSVALLAMAGLIFLLGLPFRYDVTGFVKGTLGSGNILGFLYFLVANLAIFGTEAAVYLTSTTANYSDVILVARHGLVDGQHPYLNALLLPQAWTLSMELQFYLLAPLLARLRPGGMALLTLALFTFQETLHHYLDDHGIPINEAGSLVFQLPYFLFGMLAYHAYREFLDGALSEGSKRWITWSMSALALFLVLRGYWLVRLGMRWDMFYALVATTVPFLFHLTRNNRLDRWLGELSYPIYLFHLAVIMVGARSGQAAIVWTVAVSVVYLLTLYPLFERWRRKLGAGGAFPGRESPPASPGLGSSAPRPSRSPPRS